VKPKRIPCSYNPFYAVNPALRDCETHGTDPSYPTVVRLKEGQEGCTFGEAKRQVLAEIRHMRDFWAGRLRDAKELKIEDVE
jgi:hypothetical protein